MDNHYEIVYRKLCASTGVNSVKSDLGSRLTFRNICKSQIFINVASIVLHFAKSDNSIV